MLEEADDGLRLALRSSSGDRWARMELASPRFAYRDPSNPYLADDDMVVFTVRLSGPGLMAEVSVLRLGDQLPLPYGRVMISSQWPSGPSQ